MIREPDYDSLDPDALRLFRDESGCLRLTVKNDRSYLDVKVVRAFPLSDPDHYLALLNAKAKDKVIGLVPDPGALDDASRRAADDALAHHYFLPTITRIVDLSEEFGAVYCDVETDHGPRQFVVKGIRDAIEELGGGELLIPDAEGNRYRIADWRRLDAHSRQFLERVV